MKSPGFWRFVAIILLTGVFALGQSNPNTDQGMKPYDSFHGGALDSVSMTSGNLFFHKQLYALAQRGRSALSFSLQYNNKGFRLLTSCPTQQTCTYTWLWNSNGVQLLSRSDPGSPE